MSDKRALGILKIADVPLSEHVADLIATAISLHFSKEGATLCGCSLSDVETRKVAELIEFLVLDPKALEREGPF